MQKFWWDDPKYDEEFTSFVGGLNFEHEPDLDDYDPRAEAIELCHNLFQGSEDAFIYHKWGYDAVLSIYEGNKIDLNWRKPSFYLHVKAPDGPGFDEKMMRMSIEFLLNTHAEGCKTLIHCKAGISRSVVVAGVYYSLIKDIPLYDSLEHIRKLKSKSEYWNSRWYRLLTPSDFVYDVGKKYLEDNKAHLGLRLIEKWNKKNV